MERYTCIVVIVVAFGCGDNRSENLLLGDDDTMPELPIDAGSVDAPPPIDTPPPVDAPPPDLIAICGAAPVTFDDWENCYQKRWCEWTVGCLPLNSYRDVQECLDDSDKVEGGRLSAERRERKRAVEQGRASLDVAAFTQCLAETSRAFCNTARFSVACATRFTGTIDDGADCYTDVECGSPGATCESSCTDACCLGTCRPKFKEGQACDLGDSCEPGLVCHHSCLSGDIDTRCASDRDCDWNAWCNDGFCKADLAPGSACMSGAQCGGETACIGLSIVDSSPGHCLSISRAGDHCDFLCYGNLYCDASGTCRDLPELGQSCSGFIPCRGVDTVCSNGQCVLRGDVGTGCSSSQACLPALFCTSELNDPEPSCALPGGTGQPCTDPSQCQSYLCSGNPSQLGMCLAWSDTCSLSGGGMRSDF